MSPTQLKHKASDLECVKRARAYKERRIQGVSLRLESGAKIDAAQVRADADTPTIGHGGWESRDTYEILAINADDQQTTNSPVTHEMKAVKGGLSGEDVLDAARSHHKHYT